MNSVKKLGMVILMQHDVDAAVSFYKKLGLELTFHIEGAWAEFDLGNTKLGLCPAEKSEQLKRTGIVLEIDHLKESYEAFKAAGVEFLHEPVEKVHGVMVSFKDPGLNIIDLYQPTPEKVKELVLNAARGEEQCCGAQAGCCRAEA